MPKQLDFNQIEIEQLEFDLLRLNFTNLTFIRNNTINSLSQTEGFTGHGAVLWRGSFMEAVEDRLEIASDNLLLIAHPITHPATLITETVDRVWFTPDEHTKLLGIAPEANLYLHPSDPTHTLDDIEDSDTRVMFLSHERVKLTNIQDHANLYIHPEFHDMSDFDGLLDVDGYLNFDWTSYTYSSFRYGIIRAVTFSLGGTSAVIDAVNSVDFISYVGTGLTTPTPLPFRAGFNHNSPHGMFIFGNDTDTEGFNLCSTLNPHTLKLSNTSALNKAYFSTVLSVVEAGVSLANSSSTLRDRINIVNNNYRVLGIKTNAETLVSPGSVFDPEITGGWINSSKFKFNLQSSPSPSNLRSQYKTHLFVIRDGFYAGLYAMQTPDSSNYHTWWKIDNTTFSALQSFTKYYNSGEVYIDDYAITSGGEANDGKNNAIYVEYDTLPAYGVGFKVYHKLTWAALFSSSAALQTTYKTNNSEQVIQVSICKFSEVPSSAYLAAYFITILSSNGSTSWVRLYYTVPANNSLTYCVTKTINYNVYGCAMSYNIWGSYPPNYSRANFILMAYNSQLVLYGVGYGMNDIWVVHTMATPTPFTNTACIKADPLNGNRFIITYGDRIYVYEFTINYGTVLSGYPTVTNVTLSGPIYTDGNSVEYHTNGMVTGDTSLIGTAYSRVSVVDVANRRVYQRIITKDRIAKTSCAFTTDSTTAMPILAISNPFTGTLLQYILSPLRFENNTDIGFSMWNHRVTPSAMETPCPMGRAPRLLFTYNESGINADLRLLYQNYSCVVPAGHEAPTTFYASTGAIVQYPGTGSLSILPLQTDSMIFYSEGSSSDCGHDNMYFGWFGDEYLVTTNLGTKTAYGIAGKTLIMTVQPGEIIQTGMTPNIIMFKYMSELVPDYLNVTGSSIGFDVYERLGQSSLQTDRPVTVNGENVSFSGTHLMLVLIIGAESHSAGSSLMSDITPSNPLMTTFRPSKEWNFDRVGGAGSAANGERDSFINFTSDITGTYSILPPNPVGLNPIDSRYLCLNSMGIIHYNKEDTTLPAPWDDPDEMIYGNYEGLYHIPLAKVDFDDGEIVDIHHCISGDTYRTPWFGFTIGDTIILPNRFMTTAIMIGTQIVNNPNAIPTVPGFDVPALNDSFSNPNNIFPGGVRVSFDVDTITVTGNPGQTSFITTGVISCLVRLTIKRLF